MDRERLDMHRVVDASGHVAPNTTTQSQFKIHRHAEKEHLSTARSSALPAGASIPTRSPDT